jgi:methylenetetrahydrofolate reductase (NADPH)
MSGSPAQDQGCPKHMVMGPCGGVQKDGGCEVSPHPCVFPAPVAWSDPVTPVPVDAVPLILTDFSSEPYSLSAHAAVAGILAPVSDAVLIGEHHDRPDFPPAQLASILQHAGAAVAVLNHDTVASVTGFMAEAARIREGSAA